MKKKFTEATGLPKFILAIFIIQFVVFLIYSLNKPEDKSLIYFSVGILIIGIFLTLTRLKIEIDEKMVSYKFSPFSSRKINWSDIDTFEIISLSAIGDFLGWGIRYSKKYGWGYITESNSAIFITKKNGKKVTLSIKDKEGLSNYLRTNNFVQGNPQFE